MQFKSILFVYSLSVLSSYAFAIQDENDQDDSYIDVHQHPRSAFSCEGKKVGEYYSDLSTQCQLYFVCLPNAQLKLAPTSFACPNTTRFNQATRVCSPADQVYCNIAERYFENVHGSIDSKSNKINSYLDADFDKTPWQINNNKATAKSLIVPLNLEPEYRPTERPRPSPRTLPKVETSAPKSDSPLHSSFALTFNQPQNPPRVVARTRASTTTTNGRRGNALELLPNTLPTSSNRFRPSTNTRSRLPVYSNQGARNTIVNIQPSTIATTPSTTTTTSTTTTIAPLNSKPNDNSKADYVYDYVEYDAPAPNQPSNQAAPQSNKPSTLPAIPSLEEAKPRQPVSNLAASSLFSSPINHQPSNNQPPRISSPSNASNRPPQRNQLPQSNSLNYFNSNNPFSSNPFASNPFSNSASSIIRQKRTLNDELIKSDENKKELDLSEEDAFSCSDKLPGIAYADLASKCVMYHICLPLSKGKYKDYQLFCESGHAFNQFTNNCEPIDKFDCKRSKDFYLYNKQANADSYLKNKFRISKQLAEIKN